ncbi:hypothetical protein ADJ73_13645 [Arsenicicoccus sp. oral taxon 190]|nr:hypothetical protein ADJ73_13645 [Arsenicicoccus sp. oral taxon 190]
MVAGCSVQAPAARDQGSTATRSAAPAGSSSSAGSSAPADPTPSTATAPTVDFVPAQGAKGVDPAATVSVRSAGGNLAAVTVRDEAGAEVEGRLDGDTWRPARRLRPATSYTVSAEVKGQDGAAKTATSRFTTVRPTTVAKYVLAPMDDVVGVGMPAMVTFSSSVATPQQRAEVEKHLKVTTEPATTGSWGWLSDRRLMWRPESYWKPGTKVTVEAQLAGLQTGEGKWVGRDDSETFTIGRSQISKVDMKTHQMTVVRDGQVVRTIPVTTGKDGFTTRSGTKVIMEKVGHMTMDSATVGIPKGHPEYYKLDTEWNMRVTTTGEFLHAAPWSQWAQGRRNVSHGCTNMSMANASWMFQSSMVGDVVEFTGSDRAFRDGEGITAWQYSYADWTKKSALR